MPTSYKIYLVGDTGKPLLDGKDPVLSLLRQKLMDAGAESAVIFLGDNVYPNGLPPKSHEKRDFAEKRLLAQLDMLSGYTGRKFFISGNHDWNKGKKDGLRYVKRQEKFIQNYFKDDNIFLPQLGCPGPAEVVLNDFIKLIFINTQWWVQRGKKPIGKSGKCSAESEQHFFQLLDEALNEGSHIKLIAGHRPLYSMALHGGYFNYKQHLFPFRFLHKKLYIPVPIAGSLYPLYRRYIGVTEDISYPPYRRMKMKLLKVFSKHNNLIYASGHDHNLQYMKRGAQHYIISGSGSTASYTRKGRSSVFSFSEKGFIELEVSATKDVKIIAWGSKGNGEKLYEGLLLKQ